MPKTKKQRDDDLPAYRSFEEEEPNTCALCHESIDDRVEFGKWITFGNIKVHQLCCVRLFATLLQANEPKAIGSGIDIGHCLPLKQLLENCEQSKIT